MAAETETSLTGIDRVTIAAAFIRAEGHIGAAARALGVPVGDLRALAKAEPSLIDAALEAAELAMDQAEAELLKAMRTGQLSNRLQAAAYIVKRTR